MPNEPEKHSLGAATSQSPYAAAVQVFPELTHLFLNVQTLSRKVLHRSVVEKAI